MPEERLRSLICSQKNRNFYQKKNGTCLRMMGVEFLQLLTRRRGELANKYFEMRSSAIKDRRTSFKSDNLFTGKIFCANDGAPYWMKQHYVRGKEDVKWVCSYRIKNGAKSCSSFGVSEYELKTMIANIINQSSCSIEKIAKEYIKLYKQVALQETIDHTEELQKIEHQILKIQTKMDKILDYNLDGKYQMMNF